MLTPTDYLAAASSDAISTATRVTYKKGVVTHIQGIDKLIVDNNQLVNINSNVARSIAGKFNESVQGGVSISSPNNITIKSDSKVEVLSPGEYFEYKNASASIKLNDISMNMTSIGMYRDDAGFRCISQWA